VETTVTPAEAKIRQLWLRTMRMCVPSKPLLEASGGAIVSTASMLSFSGGPLVPAYSASKGGIAQLTKALAAHWAAATLPSHLSWIDRNQSANGSEAVQCFR